jgi:hypothetical protein
MGPADSVVAFKEKGARIMAKPTVKELLEENEQLRKQLRQNEELMRRAAIRAIKLMAQLKKSQAMYPWASGSTTKVDESLGFEPTSNGKPSAGAHAL